MPFQIILLGDVVENRMKSINMHCGHKAVLCNIKPGGVVLMVKLMWMSSYHLFINSSFTSIYDWLGPWSFFMHSAEKQTKSSWRAWRKNTNKMQQYRWFIVNSRCWLLTTVSTCFGHLYAHHQAATFTVLTPYNVAPQNHNQPHPTVPAINPICSNTWSFLLMMGIKMPETCRDSSQ